MLTMLINGLTIGFILVPLAIGVYISYRILRFADISVDGTYVLGGAVAVQLFNTGVGPFAASAVSVLAGAVAGAVTGILITRFGIRRILAGILVMTALYSMNSSILNGPGQSLGTESPLHVFAMATAESVFGSTDAHELLGMHFLPERLVAMLLYGVVATSFFILLLLFFHTKLGLAIRGAGSNEDAVRAMGAHVQLFIVAALAIANGLAALSGALMLQEQYKVGISDGVGMIVTGLACVMIGDAFLGRRRFSLQFFSAMLGALIYCMLIALLMLSDLFSGDLRLFTAIFVVVALVLPRWLLKRRGAEPIEPKEV
jgi:putative tryptophan/tyrosine transport system permease protein